MSNPLLITLRLLGPGRRRALATVAAAALAATVALAPAAAHAEDADAPGGELRLQAQGRQGAALGPLAAARALQPDIAPAASDQADAELELHRVWRLRAGGPPLALTANVLAWTQHDAAAGSSAGARANELHLALDAGAWQFGAGRKVLGWDVGYGFRPNDVVQQETRRTLLPATPEGRALLQAETFGAEQAQALVWVNPQQLHAAAAASRGADESALAWRGYWRQGALDLYGFGRWGRHTRGSAGLALAWVATEAWELHASVRAMRHADGWTLASGTAAGNPWQQATRGAAVQSLLGAQWSDTEQHSLLVEAWHDGTTLSDADWRQWNRRNAALADATAPGPPAPARTGLLAWQTTPLSAGNLRRDNLFVRLAWQPQAWQLSLDMLWQPADSGRLLTAALQWQGDAWRLNAAWRVAGGPAQALLAQLPVRRTLLLAATRSF